MYIIEGLKKNVSKGTFLSVVEPELDLVARRSRVSPDLCVPFDQQG
jgi:hypothetical protein